MYLAVVIWWSDHLPVLHGINFNGGCYVQTGEPKSVIHTMLIGINDLLPVLPLLVALGLVGGHQDS